MIVDDPPYELLALFADHDAQLLVERIIERGQDRCCLRPFRWRSIRDSRHDTLCHRPEAILRPLLSGATRVLILWDHQGSGLEGMTSVEAEAETTSRLAGCGVEADRILALAFDPEVEVSLMPVWDRVTAILSDRRLRPPPAPQVVRARFEKDWPARAGLAAERIPAEHPKEYFTSLIRVLNLRPSSVLFRDLGDRLSLPALKVAGSRLEALAAGLQKWFPPPAGAEPPTPC